MRIFLRYSIGDVLKTFLKYLKKFDVDIFTILDKSSTVIWFSDRTLYYRLRPFFIYIDKFVEIAYKNT